MAYADHVNESLWNDRYAWLRRKDDAAAGSWGCVFVSTHGILLSYDIETAFCAGAWVSVIVLACAAIDATIRDTDAGDYTSSSKLVFGEDAELQRLRVVRNKLVHVAAPDSDRALPDEASNDVAKFHESFEEDARAAMELLYRTIYAIKGT